MAGQGIGRGAMVGGIAVLAGVFGGIVWLLTGQGEEAVSAEAEVEQTAAQPSAAQAESAAPSSLTSETPSAVGEDEAQEPQEAASESTAPEQPATEAEAAPEGDTAEVAAPVAPVAPMIDIARLSPDGNAVIAGQGAPGSIIRVMVDGKAAYETEADASGAFVALFDLTPSDAPRELWLETMVDGQSAAAGQVLMILPGETLAMDAGDGDGAAAEADTSASEATETQAEADPAPRLMLADESGVKLLDGAESAAALSLDSISYDAAGAVTIAGRGNGELRLYLNDTLIGSALAKAGQWALELPESVTPGVYDLRVDAIAPDGNVVERIESPFMRESQELLAEAAAAAAGSAPEHATPEAESAAPEGDGLAGSVLEAAGAVADAVEDAVSEAGGEVAEAVDMTKQPQDMARDTASDTASATASDTASDTAQAPAAETSDVAEAAATAPETEAVTAETAPTEPQEMEVAEQAADAGASGTATAAATPEAAPEADAPRAAENAAVQDPAPAVRARVVTVQPGNTLWAISRERYGEGVLYVRVFEANRAQIRDPDLIYPGQVFTLPE